MKNYVKIINVSPASIKKKAYQVVLKIGVQSFYVNDYQDTKEEAEWLKRQLVIALENLGNEELIKRKYEGV